MSNSNYTRIQAHGATSAFEPGFINQAATVGPQHGPVSVGTSKVIDVTVDLAGRSTGDTIKLGDVIPQGCVITAVVLNGNGTLEDTVQLVFGIGEAVPPSTSLVPNLVSAIQTSTPVGTPDDVGEDLNGGQGAPKAVVPVPTTPGNIMFPVLYLSQLVTSPAQTGSVNVKVVYFCP
jgi:hypothetical protein